MEKIETIKNLIGRKRVQLEQEYNITTLGIFGSYSKGKASQKSGLDILVEFSQPPTFFEFMRLERPLS